MQVIQNHLKHSKQYTAGVLHQEYQDMLRRREQQHPLPPLLRSRQKRYLLRFEEVTQVAAKLLDKNLKRKDIAALPKLGWLTAGQAIPEADWNLPCQGVASS